MVTLWYRVHGHFCLVSVVNVLLLLGGPCCSEAELKKIQAYKDPQAPQAPPGAPAKGAKPAKPDSKVTGPLIKTICAMLAVPCVNEALRAAASQAC